MTTSVFLNLRPLLLADAGVDAIVGDRIYYRNLPQNGILPAITYYRDDIDYEYLQDGKVDVYKLKVHLSGHAQNGIDAHLAVLAIDTLFNGFRGQITGAMGGTANVINSLLRSGGEDVYDPATDIHKVSTIVEIWYNAAS